MITRKNNLILKNRLLNFNFLLRSIHNVHSMIDLKIFFNNNKLPVKMLKNNVNYFSYYIENNKNLNNLHMSILKFNFDIFLRYLDKYFFIWWKYDILHANLNVRIVNTFQRWHMYYSSYTYYDFLRSLKLDRKNKNIKNVKK